MIETGEVVKQASQIESIRLPNEKTKHVIDATAAKKTTAFSMFMQGFSFVRAIGLSGYSIYAAVIAIQNPEYQKYDSEALFIVSIIALSLDILFTIFRTFPAILKSLNISESLAIAFPFFYATDVGIWSLILDKDMVMDMLTPLINAILKVYSYRFTEILSNPNATDSILDAGGTGHYSGSVQATITNTLNDQSKINFILLLLFGLTLVYLIVYHSFRIALVIGKRGSYEFGALLVLKGLLLIFNIVSSAFFLYETLVPRRLNLFINDTLTNLALAVIVPSSIVSLLSNSLVNYPMHYYYLKVTKKEGSKKTPSETPLPNMRLRELLKHAAYNTFMHPFNALIFGGYSLFSVIATAMGQIGTSSAQDYVNFSDWSRDGLLKRFVWLNVIINFLPGVFSLVAFIVLRLLQLILYCCGSRNKVQPDEEVAAAASPKTQKEEVLDQEF